MVTINDIDKLAAQNIAQLFRLLKAIPNFTNAVYVLIFHKETVPKAQRLQDADESELTKTQKTAIAELL